MKIELNSLGLRFLAILFIPLVIIFFSIAAISIKEIKREVYETQKIDLQEEAADLKNLVDIILSKQYLSIDFLSKTDEIIKSVLDDDVAKAMNYLDSEKEKLPLADALYILTPEGIMWGDTGGGKAIGIDLSKSDIYKKLKKTPENVYFSTVYEKSPISGHITLSAGRGIINNNQVVGYFVFCLNINKLSDTYVSEEVFGSEGYAFMADENGILLSHPDKDALLTDQSHDGGAVQMIITDKKATDFDEYTFKGKKKYLSYSKLENMPWFVIASISKDDLLSSAKILTRIFILVSIISLIALFLIINFMIRKIIITRIKKLEKNLVV
ncbi:MAG: cache domain-containing protein, partial [Spirochaetales bacterium]|nr:cache domain-containing protein [Spirochaetales bacterium]